MHIENPIAALTGFSTCTPNDHTLAVRTSWNGTQSSEIGFNYFNDVKEIRKLFTHNVALKMHTAWNSRKIYFWNLCFVDNVSS